MPRAEMGSQKHLANQMKSKGLQRLRWWCQICSKQCRDANGFKCHVNSESHVRQMQVVGEDPRKYIEGFSKDFQRDFIQLLRVAHGEKFVGANRFYNEYIRDKEHIHMNATKWQSLTEFIKHVGREGIVNVKEDEKDGLMIAWRDTSIEALRRREDVKAKEAAEMKNSAGEDKMLEKMAKRARLEAEAKVKSTEAKKVEHNESESQSPPAEGKTATPSDAHGKEQSTPDIDMEKPKEEAAPVKISFGLKMKTLPTGKPGVGLMKKESVFKRARTDNGDGKSVKKVKL
ncbi:zinc finger protein-like protein RTS2 [Dendryphion nanum]|uniref:Zinc finger protein-like protein RTS2 n=1 Tax=Dendryphion nanum TaxID=256645 RepID=A0A9P9I8X3_9PLEO|nr:zinc finger protein-like protein RTS2 [Dendryphion nanum]